MIWTVNGGGTISQTGLFTAGSAVGIFTVRATSAADPGVFAEAGVVISGGTINAITNPAFIGVCGSADIRVFTSGFVDPSMTLSIQGAGSLRSQTLVGTTTFSTWAASSTATGQIVVTARSVENPNLTAIATLQVDPFVGGYGDSFEGATVARGAVATLPDDSYRVTVLSAFSKINESFVATGGADGLSGTNPSNGDSITVVVGPHPQFGSRWMMGTVRSAGQDKNIEFPHHGC